TFGWGVYINMWGHELGAAALAVGFGVEVGLAYICGKAKLILGTACGLAVGGKVLFPTWADRPAGAGPSEIRGPDAPTAGPGYGYGYGRGGRPPHGHQKEERSVPRSPSAQAFLSHWLGPGPGTLASFRPVTERVPS